MTYLNPLTIPIPGQDSANNSYIQDVVGNKTDTHAGDSLYGKIETLTDHIHSTTKVYPTLANGVTVTGDAAWTLGAFVEIVPVNTITSDFDIHFIDIEDISANDVYELVLYKGLGGSEIEIGRIRFTKDAVQAGTVNQPFQTELIAANERISAKVASSSGSDNVTISIRYHTY